MQWFLDLPIAPWLGHLIIGLYLVALIAFAAIVLVKMRVTPIWALVLLVPLGNVIGAWLLAYARWPRFDGPPEPQSRR